MINTPLSAKNNMTYTSFVIYSTKHKLLTEMRNELYLFVLPIIQKITYYCKPSIHNKQRNHAHNSGDYRNKIPK